MSVNTAFSFTPGVPEQIADHLQTRIVTGDMAAGERIAEARVTEALGVSRGPVREALRVLAARHLVEVMPRRGARVSRFGPTDVRGLYDMQIALLTLLATRVADVLDASMLEILQTHRDALRRAADVADTLSLLDHSQTFLRVASDLIGNAYLRDTLDRMGPAFNRAHYRALSSAPDQATGLADFIDDLIAAVVGQNHDYICATIRRYGERQMADVLSTFPDDQSSP
ncbi:MAG: GntR family transcriptional regulator [Gammaproteobacteria bacterium]